MIKQGKRTIKYYLAALSTLLAVLCVAGLLFALYANKEAELARVQAEALALLDSREGEYDAQSIVLRDTTHNAAEKLATRLGATLRITENGEFATLTLPEGVDIRDIYNNAENREVLGFMSPDFFVYPAELTPTRPDYAVSDTEYEKQTYLDYINIGKTWEQSKGDGVTVAVIDTGIDTDHPEFSGKISEYSYNVTEDKSVKEYGDWSLIEDSQGHGTAVCGVISAAMDGEGIVGIAPEATLLVIKAECGANGAFWRSSDVTFGVYYAIEQGADVISMSLGGDENITKEATRLAVERGIICVAAAGNSGTSTESYPAADENVIGVGALAVDSFELAGYSNYGINTDIVAPGTVYTALMGGKYGVMNGTSFACPAVSAAVALYLSQNEDADFDDVLAELQISSRDLGEGGADARYGYGALDVNALICEERGTLTLDMNTDAVTDMYLSFVRNHTLQGIPQPTRYGYVFGGWYYDKALTKPLGLYVDIFTNDLTLYAKWTEAENFPYTYTELSDGTIMITGYVGNEKEIVIPSQINGKIVSAIKSMAFFNAVEVERVEIPTTVTTFDGSAFFGASSIKEFSLSTTVSYTFSVVDGVLFDGAKKTIVAYPAGRDGEYDIPDSVTTIGTCAFAYSRIKTADLADIKRIESYAFVNTGLESLSVPYNVTFMGRYAFAANQNLQTLRVGKGVVSVPEYAFAYCTALKTVSIPSGVLEIDNYAFYKNISLQTVEFERNSSVALINSGAFTECGIKQISFPQSLLSIGEKAFYNNASLTSIGFAEGSKITQIDTDAFAYCTSLSKLEIPDSATRIGENAFRKAAITELVLSANVKYLGGGAFAECSKLQNIEVDAENTLYTSVDGVLYNADKTSLLAYPAGKQIAEYTVQSGITSIGEAAFCGAEGLKKVSLPSTLSHIGREAFRKSGLTEVNIGDNITHIGAYAFSGLRNLTRFNVSATHTVFTEAGGLLYSKDMSVLIAVPSGISGELTLPDSVLIIDFGAFEGSALTRINVHDKVEIINAEAFKDSSATIYCREGTAMHMYGEANNCRYLLLNETAPESPALLNRGETTLTLVPIKGYEYRLDDGEWQSSNIFSGLERNKKYTFYQREAGTENKLASIESEAAFETLGHSYGELTARLDADCEHEGMEAHYLCANCGEYLDENMQQTTKEALRIAKTEHVYGDDNICDICKKELIKATEHTDITDVTEKPDDTQEFTETQPTKKGCKSYVAASCAIFAVTSLGFAAAFKKKSN